MKILRLSGYYYPEQVASSHLIDDLEEAFEKEGFLSDVYVPVPSRNVDESLKEKYQNMLYEERRGGTIRVHRFLLSNEKKGAISRAIRYLKQNIKQYKLGKKAKDIDLIFASSTPPTQGFLCGKVKKKLCKKYKRNVPFIYNLQDIFPDSLVSAGMTKKGSLIYKIGRKIENYSYKMADKIIVISEGFKSNLMQKGVDESKIVVIPNWIDSSKVISIDRKDNVLFDRYNLDRNKFYVTYSGNLGLSQNLDMLLDIAKEFKDEIKDLHFVLIGEGAKKEELQKRIEEEQIKNVDILPFQPYSDIAHVFSLGDVGLIISKSKVGGSSVPSKTWSIMSAKRPIIASFDEDSELFRLVKEEKLGLTAKADDKEELKNAIRQLYSNREEATFMGETARKYVEENLNKEKCVGAYIDLIKSLVK